MNSGPEMLGAFHHFLRDDAFLHDPLIVVDVVQEQIQRGDALDQSGLDVLPLSPRDDARQEIEGEDALGALVVVVDRKSDALVEKGLRSQRSACARVRRRPSLRSARSSFR